MGPLRAYDHDPTLHLPRILCLHGGGTNAHIFRMQCRVLARHLAPAFRLCFADAPFASPAGPDVLSVYKEHGPFRAWLPPQHDDADDDATDDVSAASRIRAALDAAMAADDACGATGQWTALLGFSQGARIVASVLHMQQTTPASGWPVFRFGILLAGRGPLVALDPARGGVPRGLVGAAAAMAATATTEVHQPCGAVEVVRIPSIHVHGLLDPGVRFHRRLVAEWFDARSVVLREWEGGHRVPIKTGDVGPLVEEILGMDAVTRGRGGASGWARGVGGCAVGGGVFG